MKNSIKGYIFAFIALFSWGIHGPAGRYLALHNVNMIFVTGLRFWIGTIIFGLFLLIKKDFNLEWKKNLKLMLLTSFIGLIGNSVLYHLTLIFLPGTIVMILENLAPIFVFGMSYILYKIKPTKIEILSFFIALFGVILIVFGKSSLNLTSQHFYIGIILGLLTGLTFGLYTFLSSEMVKAISGNPLQIIKFLFKVFLLSSLMMLPVILMTKNMPKTNKEWFWLIEMGVFQSGLSYLFWNYALKYLPVNTTSVLFIFTIFFTTINEVLFMNLRLNFLIILGGILISLAGIFITRQKQI